ncbi:pentapeptide repeat-containing protein, partial [bacterium]|nr:pentapeptide repeat-containing protein [bacterium]
IYKLIEMQFDEKAKEGFGEILPILGAACNANPRSVIRLINNVLVDWAIAWESYETEKIPLAAFAISRALQERERWKKIFNFLIQRSNNVIGNWVLLYIENFDNLDERAEILREWENEDPRSAEQIPKLIEDEEDLQKLLNSNPGRIYLSDHEIRKACAQLSRMPTSESTASDEPVELRETWPWADDFTPDDWPMYKDYQIRPNANLIGVNLAGVDLRRADLRNANLTEANLAGVNLEGAKLQGSNLQGAHLERSNLRWTDLGGSNLRWTDLTAADLEGANLLWADVTRASLKSTNLRKAKLPGSVEEIRKICDCDEKTIWPEESESQYKIL